jgi:citrate lyase beta subunit
MGNTTIPDAALASFLAPLDKANVRTATQFPGDSPARQPIHTVYGGAHLFRSDAASKLGALALKALQDNAPDAAAFGAALGLDPALAQRVYLRVIEKLTNEPVEDYRIDFEDGFGNRPDAEEDSTALAAADAVAAGLQANTLPPAIGIRIKPLSEDLKRRSLRTFDLFLTRLLERTGGTLPPNFVVTLPKITSHEQVAAMASACDAFEYWRDIPADQLRFELMIETTQSVFAPDGTIALPRFIAEGRGRIVAAHFGTYDYTAACGITAAPAHAPSGLRFRQARDADRASPAPASGFPTAPPTSCRSERARACIRRGACIRAMYAIHWKPASIRAGICTRRSCRPDTPRSTRFFSRDSTPRQGVCRISSSARRKPRSSATSSTTRPPARGC